jgi:hypothetical protein
LVETEILHNEVAPIIIWVIKSKRMQWAGHVTHGSRREVHMGFWWGNMREGGHLEVLGIDESIILKRESKKLDRGYGQD